jgi:cytochrome c oxidase subunit 4
MQQFSQRIFRLPEAISPSQLLCCKLLASAVFVLMARRVLFEGHNWGDDFGLYLQLAKNIRNGDPYNHLNTGIEVPPGFPLLLAIWSKYFGTTFVGLKSLNIVSWLAAAWIASLLATRTLGRLAGGVVLAAHFIVPMYYVQQQSVLSDLPFTALVNLLMLLSFVYFHKMRQSQAISPWLLGAIPGVLLLAMLIRPAGLPLGAAIVGCAAVETWLSRGDRAVMRHCVSLASAVVLTVGLYLLVFGSSANSHLANAIGGTDASGGKILALIALIGRRVGEEVVNLDILFAGYPVEPWMPWMALILVMACVAGCRFHFLLTRDLVLSAFLASYLAFILLVPWQQGFRYLFPIVSIALIACLAPLKWLATITHEWPRTALVAAIVATLLSATVATKMVRATAIYYHHTDNETADAQSRELLYWLSTMTRSSEMICSFKPRAVMYYTSRKTCYIPNDLTGDVVRYLQEQKADYAVLILRPAYQYEKLDAALHSSPHVQQIFRNDDYVVYKLE